MASRLPLELLHDIILLNDDSCSKDGLETESESEQFSLRNFYLKEKPKPCAKSIALVCRYWFSFVAESPCLWISSLCISVPSISVGDGDSALRDALSFDTLSSKCDLDIYIECPESTDDPNDLASLISSFLQATVQRWRRFRMIDSRHTERYWTLLPTDLSNARRLKSVNFGGRDPTMLQSLGRWNAPNLEHIDIDIDYPKPTPILLLDQGEHFQQAFRNTRYATFGWSVPRSDMVIHQIVELYRLCPPTQDISLEVVDYHRAGINIVRLDLKAASSRITQGVSRLERELRLKGPKRLIMEVLQTLPMQELTAVALRPVDTSDNSVLALDHSSSHPARPSISSLRLLFDYGEITNISEYLDCTNLTELDILLHNGMAISLAHAFPALRCLSLITHASWVQCLPFGLSGLEAPMLRDLSIKGLKYSGLEKPPDAIKLSLPNLQKATFLVDADYPSLTELAILATIDAAKLLALDITRSQIGRHTSKVNTLAEWIQDVLARVQEFYLVAPCKWNSFLSFVKFMPNLAMLGLTIDKTENTRVVTLLGCHTAHGLILPLLERLEIIAQCPYASIVEKLTEAILSRRKAGVPELKLIKLTIPFQTVGVESIVQLKKVVYHETAYVLAYGTRVEVGGKPG
jgi:hypothetical protein